MPRSARTAPPASTRPVGHPSAPAARRALRLWGASRRARSARPAPTPLQMPRSALSAPRDPSVRRWACCALRRLRLISSSLCPLFPGCVQPRRPVRPSARTATLACTLRLWAAPHASTALLGLTLARRAPPSAMTAWPAPSAPAGPPHVRQGARACPSCVSAASSFTYPYSRLVNPPFPQAPTAHWDASPTRTALHLAWDALLVMCLRRAQGEGWQANHTTRRGK